MTRFAKSLRLGIAAPLALMSSVALATPIEVDITVDNSYALFTGDLNGATSFVGSNFNWQDTETYNLDLGKGAYIYVVTASDLSVAQGFLGQFTNLDTNERFYSHDAAWQVMATGLGGSAPYSGSAANLELLSKEIQDANAGGNPSGGWVAFTAGQANGAGPWGFRPNIDDAAKWVWYQGGSCTQANPTQGGCNAGEWLTFRIAVGATRDNPVPNPSGPQTPSVPEPAVLGMLGLGVISVGLYRRRRAAA